jgi:hypothetical protein
MILTKLEGLLNDQLENLRKIQVNLNKGDGSTAPAYHSPASPQ